MGKPVREEPSAPAYDCRDKSRHGFANRGVAHRCDAECGRLPAVEIEIDGAETVPADLVGLGHGNSVRPDDRPRDRQEHRMSLPLPEDSEGGLICP